MNSYFALALCLTAVLAAPQLNDQNHYATHAESVKLARHGHSARLGNLQDVPSDDVCGLCQSSHSGSDLSHATANGVGYVSASDFSSTSSDASAPLVIPVPGGDSRSEFHSSSHQTENFGAGSFVAPVAGGSESYTHQSETSSSSTSPVVQHVVYSPQSSGSERYQRLEKVHTERVIQSKPAPIVTVFSPLRSEHFTQSRHLESESTIPGAPILTFTPSVDSSFSSHLNQRMQQQQQFPVAVPASNSHYSSHISKVSQQSAAPASAIIVPVYGGGQSVSHSEKSASTHSSHSNLAAPQTLFQSAPLAISRYSSEHSLSSGNFGGNVGVAGYPRQHSSRFGSEFGSKFGSKFGSEFGSEFGSSLGGSSNLNQYMSESERLAQLQAENIQISGGYKASSVSDIGIAPVVPASTGARTKSWEKNSKWASESEYDQTGKTKTSGFISTAEGEDETVNGRSTGFRAATTTVEDNGKRSTYSIHTP